MGALSNFRKRGNEYLSLSIDSPDKINQIDTNQSKKRRISNFNQFSVENNSVSRLRKYPEPVGRLRRELHAPCRSNRVGFLSCNRGIRVSDSRVKEGSIIMGNVIGSFGKLRRDYEATKRAAFDSLRHVKVDEKGPPELVVIEDGEGDGDGNKEEEEDKETTFESDELGLVVEPPHDLDRKGYENLVDREAYKELLSSVERRNPKIRRLEFEIKLNEAKLVTVRSWWSPRKQQDEKKPEEDLLRAAFVPLSQEEEDEVKTALLNANRRKILATHENSNIQISGEVLQCLRPGAWLNDEVINVYLELLKERERREPKKHLTCHFFSTFFYKKLIGGRNGYDYKAVKRWTSLRKLGYKLSECDKIFVPIHKEVHWCLAVINKKDKTFQYLDSLGGRDSQVLRVLAKYYVDEVKDKCGEDIDVTSWALEYVEDLPEQQNGFDCGVFMIKYADFYSKGTGLHFSQENMPYFRRRTAKELLRLQAH